MADFLKVTTPPTGYENTTRSNPITTNDTNIQNIIDPSKVTRPDGQGALTENPENNFALSYDSNFDKFVQLLKGTPALMDSITELLFTNMGTIVNSGIGENFANEISQFMQMLKMSESELLDFLKNQSSSSVRFKGAFFNVLRQAMSEPGSLELKTNVLDFLKRYNDMAGGKHIMKNIMRNLGDIAKWMPQSYRQPLLELAQRLNPDIKNGDTAQNAAVLKNDIIPFLSEYVGRTHDLGKTRDFITLLTQNIARYENGNKESFHSSFLTLLGFRGIKEKLVGLDPKLIQTVLQNTEFERASANSSLMDKLTSIIQRGMEGQAGVEAKSVFENITNSILINESVYMPLVHLLIPAEINGNLLFSEIWIDPDAQSQPGEENGGEDEKKVKLFIKFDIKDVGFFDVVILSREGKLDVQLYYPEKLAPMERSIKTGISGIIENNGLSFRSLLLEKSIKPKSLSEVFPKIYERKNAVNVRI